MGTQGGEFVFRCPCYDGYTEYQKIVDLKDAGLVIYRQTSKYEEKENDGTITSNVALASSSEDIFILQNTKDAEILSADILPAFDPNKISCPRCRHIIENAQKLLKTIPKINKNDIMGICDHCRKKLARSPCKDCDEVVKRFVIGKDEAKDAKRHIKIWLSKIHHLLRDVVIAERNIFKRRSRTYSDINFDNLHHNSPVSLREPEVTDLFYSESLKTSSTRTLHMTDREYYSHSGIPKTKKKTTFFDYLEQEKYLSPVKDKRYRSKSHQNLSYIAHDIKPFFDSQRDEFGTKKITTDKTLTRVSVPPISDIAPGKYQSDESIYPLSKYQYLSDDTLAPQRKRQHEDSYTDKHKDKLTMYGKHAQEDRQKYLPHGRRSQEKRFMEGGKLTPRETNVPEDKTRISPRQKHISEEMLPQYEIPTREAKLRKHKSEETLLTSVSGIIKDQFKQDFGYFFPHEVEDTIKIRKKRISSSELIKDTQDKLKARAEEKRLRLLEEERKKKEEEERKRIAREKERKRREEEKRAAEEARRLAAEEEKRIAEEAKRIAEEERKLNEEARRLAEEDKKKLADEEKKRVAEEKKRLAEEKKQQKLQEKEKEKEKKSTTKTVKEVKSEIRKTHTEKPKEKEPPLEKPKTRESSPAKPKVKEPPPDKPKVKEPPPDKPKVKEQIPLKSKVQEPVPEKQKFQETSAEKPVVKESIPEKPTVKKPVQEKPKIAEPPPEAPKNKEPPLLKEQPPKSELKEKPKKEKPEPTVKEKEPKKEKTEKDHTTTTVKEPVKEEIKEPVKPKPEPKAETVPGDDFRKLVEEQAKLKEERLRLKKLKEEEDRKAREAAEKKLKEMDQQAKSSEIKPTRKSEPEKPKVEKKQENPTTKDLNIKQIKVRKPSGDDLILRLVKLKQSAQGEKLSKKQANVHHVVIQHKRHNKNKDMNCLICTNSDIELDLESIANKREEIKMADIIIGPKIFKYKPPIPPITEKQNDEQVLPILFTSSYKEETASAVVKTEDVPNVVTEEIEKKSPPLLASAKGPTPKGKQPIEQEVPKGIVRYALSDRSFIDKGWTMLPTEKVVRKMNVYRMRPAHPEFDWFEHNRNKRLMTYDTGEKLAEFDDNGRGRWFYKNGRLALDYYDAEEINAQQRFVVYSSGEPDERGRSRPITILATFDYLGNGIVFDHSGKIRLKYNQTEGVVLDRAIGPVSHWKWHTLNDPPVLQQVMIDTQMPHKDADIIKLGGPGDNKARPDNEEMLAIEFDNFIKEKSKKLTQKFKPFQIKMKALKINESFSLRVLDQATIYLIFRDGSANLKLNIGMILDHKEIVDTDTAEVGEVSNNLQRLPARTDSIAGLQRSVAYAQRVERLRVERERRLRPADPSGSADRLAAAASRPLRAPFRTVSEGTLPTTTSGYPCKCRKPSSSNLYYDTRLF